MKGNAVPIVDHNKLVNLTVGDVHTQYAHLLGRSVGQTFLQTLEADTGDEFAWKFEYTTNKSISGNDTGLVINYTDTASPGASLLIDAQVGGVSKFNVTNSGAASFAGALAANKVITTSNPFQSLWTNPGTVGAFQYNRTITNIGDQVIATFSPTYNQASGAASNTDLLINRTETAVGSGDQLLIDAQVGGVSKFNVDNNGNVKINGNIVLPKASGNGIKIDNTIPTFGWRDLLGSVEPKTIGAGKATLGAFRGGKAKAWFYDLGDTLDTLEYHIPHDYVPGTDLYIHLHWGHHGTAISGSLVVTFGATCAKGHNQQDFPAEVAPVLTVSTPNIATIPQYRHRVDEIQLSASSPSATQLNNADIEPDTVILIGFEVTTEPTITGGVVNKTAFFEIDIHYQSTNIATKDKIPDFYT